MFIPKSSTINKIKNSYEDIIAWKEPARTVKYFVFYMFFVYYFNIWWIPLFLVYNLFINWKYKEGGKAPLEKVLKDFLFVA